MSSSSSSVLRRPPESRPVRWRRDALEVEQHKRGPADDVEFFVWLRYYSELTAVALWDSALWDDSAALWAGPPAAVDIGCDVISISTASGRDAPLGRFRPSSAVVQVDDPDGLLSPWVTAAHGDQYSAVRPGIELSIEARHVPTDVTYPIFAGMVDAISDTFPNVTDHRVTFTCSDALSLLGAYDGIEQPAVGAGELAGARMRRIVAMAGYLGPINFDAGIIPLQATTLAQNALNEAGLVTDTELGALFVQPDGVMRLVDRNGMVSDPRYTQVQFTFGEVEPELCYADIELVTDRELVRNVVSVANAGGTAVTRSDTASIGLYGRRSYQRMDLIHVDPAQSDVIAQQMLAFFADASRRIDELELVPSVTADVIVPALTIQLLWKIQVRRRATGLQVIADLQVQGIEHDITADEWRCSLKTFSASAVLEVGRWNVGRWDSALWAF